MFLLKKNTANVTVKQVKDNFPFSLLLMWRRDSTERSVASQFLLANQDSLVDEALAVPKEESDRKRVIGLDSSFAPLPLGRLCRCLQCDDIEKRGKQV